MAERKAAVTRNTLETQITVSVNLDGSGESAFDTGIPFLEHMLDQIARHGLFDLDIKAVGDLHIDDHHTVEDIGITLGQAVARAKGKKWGGRKVGTRIKVTEAKEKIIRQMKREGRPITEIARTVEVSRQTIYAVLARKEARRRHR